MSCSQFIEHDDEDKSDTLVVIVNGDGTVSVDRETLERVLQQQSRTAVSFIKLEDADEPDSQSGKVNAEGNEATPEEKENFCHKVNLVVEGYYPPPPLNMANKNCNSVDSVVSSTVATPPLPQSSSDFLDLLSDGLEIPVSNMPASTTEGCIGDSLVDAFSEMAPEQLKQVETALHSEKAKQILGDDVTSVLDTLKLKEEDDWVHFDHCYTNIYGNKKSPSPSKTENVAVEDSEEATYVTIKMNENTTFKEETKTSSRAESSESLNKVTRETSTKKNQVPDFRDESVKLKRKSLTSLNNSKSENLDDKTAPKRSLLDMKNLNSAKEKRSVHILSKVKRKSSSKSESAEQPPERVVTEDEVDGVKVFKPTRSDKKLVRSFIFSKDNAKSILSARSQLIQTKLNFNKKEGNESTGSVVTSEGCKEKNNKMTRPEISAPKQRTSLVCENDENKNVKKETPRKQPSSITPETFGPALFSTPDIIRKINSDETLKDVEKSNTPIESSRADDTGDIEKQMSAIENGEAILDRIHMQFEMQNKQRYSSHSDDDRLLSDLENTDDESKQVENDISSSFNGTKKVELGDSNSEFSSRKSSNIDKSDNSDKEDVDYEDDPNKLWCICNKPHGNRFMICCDACDNWYHGSCVGVTRPMGEKMELNGTEWLCPSCRKEKYAKEREMKLKLVSRNTGSRAGSKHINSNSPNTSISDSYSSVPVDSGERTSSQIAPVRKKQSSLVLKIPQSLLCIECKEKEVMPDAIYCGKECIIRQVDTFVRMNSTPDDPLPDEQKIIVVDKKRDHRITGMRAPSVAILKEWLMEHPSYEIVRPSAFPMSRPVSTLKQNKPTEKPADAAKPTTPISKDSQNNAARTKLIFKLKDNVAAPGESNSQTSIRQFFTSKSANEVNQSKIKKIEDGCGHILIREGNVLRTVSSGPKKDADPKVKEKQRQIKLIPFQPLAKPVQGEEPKPTQQIVRKIIMPVPSGEKDKKRKVEAPVKEKPPVAKKVEIKRQDSKKSLDEGSETSEQTPVPTKAPEPIRAKLKKSLGELFVSRSKDIIDLAIPENELIALATQVEEELFNFFKQTGQKYKNKYRSLVFNLRDQKNNLFRRVAEKNLSPHELVRLTPEELASTELAQWRQREAKHEIDMIKKTELENLSQSKVLVVKTHKGELEIESESLPPSKTDTVVPDLQPDEIPLEKDKSRTVFSATLIKEKHGVSMKEKESLKEEGDKKDRHKKSDHRERDRHKTRKHRHRSSERDHHRSRSRRRSRSVDKVGHKISVEKNSHRSRSSDKSRSSRSDDRKDRHQSRTNKHKRSRSRSRRKHRSNERKDDDQPSNEIVETPTQQTEKSPKTIDPEKPTEDDEKIAADLLSSYNAVDVDLSDMEPTSTVTIKTPPYDHSPDALTYVWKGMITMPEVAKFHTVLREVSGNCEGLDEDLPSVIECVGRIRPEVMWRYISEVKKSGHEILVLRFEVQDETQQLNYLSLYSYLSTKNRMGVIGCSCPSIKDFYVMTLASHSPVPQVLLPLDGPGFEDNRSHMLLGIIVRTRRKKYSANVLPTSSSSSKKTDSESHSTSLVVPPAVESDSFTPPHSPTSVFVNMSNSVTAPSITENSLIGNDVDDDDDEPYSPEDDDEEPYSPSALDDEHSSKSMDLEREMEEINRKIAEERQKQQKLSSLPPASQDNQNESNETYSPTDHFSDETETSKVQLPDDLQQLFASFGKRSNESASAILQADPIVSAYKRSADDDDDAEEATVEPAFSSPEVTDDTPAPTETLSETTIEESLKLSRDPRRKQLTESFSTPVNQPPPPGMEDEFASPGNALTSISTTETTSLPLSIPESTYAVSMQAAQFSYTAAAAAAAVATVPAYPPAMIAAHPQMYITQPPVFPQPGTLPYAAISPAQLYVPPTVLHDPSMIPLPVDGSDKMNLLKRKATEDSDDDEDKDKSGCRKSELKSKKSQSYYSTDSKSRRSHSRSPSRYKSSGGYDLHRRSYSRDDSEYGNNSSSSSHSRYSYKHGKSYPSRRSSYWKGGSDYSSSHRKYSDRSRRSSSREKSSRRYDNAKSS